MQQLKSCAVIEPDKPENGTWLAQDDHMLYTCDLD